jgi:lipid-A-disaccharide synthase-like uncharacterized protein
LSNHWREFLYYPLGLLPALFFSLRFLIQWGMSEKAHRSVVPPLFWTLSLTGNCLLLTHYFLQFQYPFALIQVGNALISWRNINLMQRRGPPHSFSFTLRVFAVILLTFGLAILIQELTYLPVKSSSTLLLQKFSNQSSTTWLMVGFIGQVLFASRFWLQWWQAEQSKNSELRTSFWVISLLGTMISLSYFVYIWDTVSMFNHSFSVIPYMRNLMLIKKNRLKGQAMVSQ